MLDPRLLRSFTAIVDAGSFTLAAERLNMTQSTISQQLARLEEAVGSALVDRAARPVEPTAAGERLLGYARRILALHEEAESALGDPAGTTSIRIGLPEDIVSNAMAAVFGDFARHHRATRLDVTAGLSRDLTRRYRAGEFDIVIVKEPAADPDCRATFPEAMAWFESADAPAEWPNPIPLVAFPPGGALPRGDVRTHRTRTAPLVHRLLGQQSSQRAGRGGGRARPVPPAQERGRRISRSPICSIRRGASDRGLDLFLGKRRRRFRPGRTDEDDPCRQMCPA